MFATWCRRVSLGFLSVCAFLGGSEVARAQTSNPQLGTEGIVSIFPVTGGIAGFNEEQGALIWFKKEGSSLAEKRKIPVNGHVWGVAEAGDTTYIAEGMGRKNLTAPLRVLAIQGDGSQEVAFEHNGERNQASYLRFVNGKLWITYFESKYMTRSGYCEFAKSTKCSFVEVARMRLGDAVDVYGDSVVIGRPYGDVQGQDGDLFLIEKGKETLLPSYRGVRAVAFFGEPSAPKIAVGDGWHQNYGQLAQGRLSLLMKDGVSNRYSLTLIDRDSKQYGFSKIVPFVKDGKQHLAALGNKTLVVYGPEPEWAKVDLYTRISEDRSFDFVAAATSGGDVEFVVVDGGVRIVRQ